MVTDVRTEEHRSFRLSDIHIEQRAAGGGRKLVGHAAVFDLLSDPLADGYRERVLPGAFTKTLRDGADVRALFNHDPNYVLGRTKSGTLKLEEDARGLAVEIQLSDTTFAADLVKMVERRDVDQMSFGFRAVRDRQTFEGGKPVRELLEVELFDVSPVTYPAYPQTDLQARSRAGTFEGDRTTPASNAWEAEISGPLFRIDRGVVLPGDRPAIDRFVRRLTALLPEGRAAIANPHRRRQLDLAEIEIDPIHEPVRGAARFGYVLISEDDVPANIRDAVHDTVARTSDDLRIPAPQIAWYDAAPAGRPADFSRSDFRVGEARDAWRGVATILIMRGRSLDETIRTTAHEVRHIWQMRGGERRRHLWEFDARRYGERVEDEQRARAAEEAAGPARRQRGWW